MIGLLQILSRWLVQFTALFIIAIAALTFWQPWLFAWVKGSTQTAVLGIIMLGMGMTLTVEDFRGLAQRPLDIFIGACAQFTIMPLGAYLVVHLLALPPAIAVGLLLVGCAPGGVSSNIMTFLCKGDVAYSVGMTTASTVLAPLMTPMLMLLLAGQTISIPALSMFQSMLLVTLLPVTVGALLNYGWREKSFFPVLVSIMPGVSVLALACIVGGVVACNGSAFFRSGVMIFLAISVHNGLGYFMGYCVGVMTRLTLPKRRTLSIEVGMQNAGLATNLAVRHFPALPEAAVAAAVSCVWHSISGTLIAALFSWMDARRRRL
jgi:BASS family bile acid:Na+ symporter